MARRCELWGADQASDGQLITGPAATPGAAACRPHRTLIIGGARSGKSTEAELRLAAEPQVPTWPLARRPAGGRACRQARRSWTAGRGDGSPGPGRRRARCRVGTPRRHPPGAPAGLVADRREPGHRRGAAPGDRRAAHRRHRHLAGRVMDEAGHVGGEADAGPAPRAEARAAAIVAGPHRRADRCLAADQGAGGGRDRSGRFRARARLSGRPGFPGSAGLAEPAARGRIRAESAGRGRASDNAPG